MATKPAKKAPAKKAPAKKTAAKPAAKKPAAKPAKPAAKKPVAKKAAKPAPKAPAKPVKAAAAPKGKPAASKPADAPTGAGKREIKNGVARPRPNSIAAQLWAIADDLKAKLGRPPARFEFRQACEGKGFVSHTISFQFHFWRTFNSIPGRALGIYPKRNSFELSVPTPYVRKRDQKEAAEPAKAANKPAKASKPPVEYCAPPEGEDEAQAGVSSRLSKASAQAAK
jgi:hypothetical protein